MTPTLLIAEDDIALARLAARVAEEVGFDVVVRHDGDAARNTLETDAPDALLPTCAYRDATASICCGPPKRSIPNAQCC